MGTPSRPVIAAASLAALVLLASPAARHPLEARLATHMLVQLPLLVLVGVGVGSVTAAAARPHLRIWNGGGCTGLLVVLAIATFWMLPRAMDAALVDMRFEAGKFVSLPAAGVALAWSYPQANVLVKGLLNAHAVSALGVMGWAYLAAPVRLCNGYLAADQQQAGTGLLAVGGALSAYFAVRVIGGPGRARSPRTARTAAAETCIATR